MASDNSLCKKLLNVKDAVVENYCSYYDSDGVQHIRILVRPYAQHENDCEVSSFLSTTSQSIIYHIRFS